MQQNYPKVHLFSKKLVKQDWNFFGAKSLHKLDLETRVHMTFIHSKKGTQSSVNQGTPDKLNQIQ